MKKNPIYVNLDLVRRRSRFRRLSRSKADDSTLLVIVSLTSVSDVTGLFKFQEQCINAIVEPDEVYTVGRFVQVNHADQRVQRFKAV